MEDNVKGLIRTCCIVLIISVGLSVVYSAKRPYIYLVENYDYSYQPESPQLHPNRPTTKSNSRVRSGGGSSGNNYNNKIPHPFLFQGTHRNGEVKHHQHNAQTGTTFKEKNEKVVAAKEENSQNTKKKVKVDKNEEAKKKEISAGGSGLKSFPFPIPWDWNERIQKMNKVRKEATKKDTSTDRFFNFRPRLPKLPPLPTIDFKFQTLNSDSPTSGSGEIGRRSRSHVPRQNRGSSSTKQINFADIITPETLSFISKLQMLNVSKLTNGVPNAGAASIINLAQATGGGADEIASFNPNVGSPLLSGDFLTLENQKPFSIPKDTQRQPTAQEIAAAYHKLKHKFNKPTSAQDKNSEEDDEPEDEPEDDEAEDDTSVPESDTSQQQSEEEIGSSKSKESKESKEGDSKEEQPQDEEPEQEQEQSEEALDASDEEALSDAPSSRTKTKLRRPESASSVRTRPTFGLSSYGIHSLNASQPLLSSSIASIAGHTGVSTTSTHGHNTHYQDNPFEPAGVVNPDPNDAAKPVIILLNVPKPTELKGDTGVYEDPDYVYGDEDKKAKKKEKKWKKKEEKKKKKENKKKKKKKKKGGGESWGPPPTQRPSKKGDILNRLTKVSSNVQEIYNVFKGVLNDYVVNRPHIGIEFIHTNRKTPPPHVAKPPPKKEDDDDDDEKSGEKGWKSNEEEKEKSSWENTDDEQRREKSDDRKLRLPGGGGGSGSYEEFEEDNQSVAVGGKPTLWNPLQWSFSYPSSTDNADSPAAISKRFQECQNTGGVDCASYIDGPMKYEPPRPIYMESVVSSESAEKPPRPPFREPPPRISTGSSEKVWVKTWDKESTGLPKPVESAEKDN